MALQERWSRTLINLNGAAAEAALGRGTAIFPGSKHHQERRSRQLPRVPLGDGGGILLLIITLFLQVNDMKQARKDAQGLAPFGLDPNALVLIDGKDIYSTIKKHRYNGRIPRFRRIKGSTELYTSDTVMNNPQFVKAAIIKQDTPDNEKIYYFFREDNPDWPRNSAAPKIISRVAQLCKGDKEGSGSLSCSKWTTFLKATLFCVDEATDRHFNHLQDIVIVESPVWSETAVYGLFSNEWDYSAVCVFSFGGISEVFRKSRLKGYNGKLPAIRPGQSAREEMTPQETFRVADSYPEVLDKVKKQAVFYSEHHYQQMGVHQVQAADEASYNVLYLTTGVTRNCKLPLV
ncbi:semaphorin-7A-like [Anolis sagrei]|uniref:semaphorin-7A-like n=1 Tax=Anolis sagrei TaxID=38937 RepID=UPI003520997B